MPSADSSRICSRCVLTSSFPRIRFDDRGVCSVCREYDRWWKEWNLRKHEREKILYKICKQAKSKRRKFDALIPLSGGKDSTYVLYVAQQKLGLKCLAYTLDIGYLSNYAKNNITKACEKMGVEHIYYKIDPKLINELFALFIRKTGWFCSVCMRAIQASTFEIAEKYRIPLIIKGTSLRTELPLAREMFQGGDLTHIRSVLKGEIIAKKCKKFCSRGYSIQRGIGQLLFWLFKQRRLFSYAYFNLADFIDWDYNTIYKTITQELGWVSPSNAEHMDCTIHPIQRYIHNRRFPGLEMKRLTFARLVMAGLMTREEALRKLEEEPDEQCPETVMDMFLKNINMTKEEFDYYVDLGPRHLQYPRESLLLRMVKSAFRIKDAGIY
ncbi:MAG: N-acetyl sugar amidotransferase [Candidatus Aenigmatarchaeota archaeon]